MAKHLEQGKQAEALAAQFLIEKGYEIIKRNYRYKRAEVDIIVKKGIFLIFVEVKSLSNISYGMPEIKVNQHKITLVTQAADNYIYQINWQQQIRFDIISIIFSESEPQIMHFEDAFY